MFVTRDDLSLELLKSYKKQFIEYQARNGSQTVNLNRFETVNNAYFIIRSLPIGFGRKTVKKNSSIRSWDLLEALRKEWNAETTRYTREQ